MKSALPLAQVPLGPGIKESPAARTAEQAKTRQATIAGLSLLVLAVATDRFGLQLTTMHLRLELIASGLLALWCLFRFGPAALRGLGKIELALAGWLAVGAFSSWMFSPARDVSMRFVLLIAGLLTLYGVGFMLMRSRQAITWAAVAWVVVGSIVMLAGLFSALMYTFTGWTGGVSFNRIYQDGVLSATPMVYSTLWEANIFGSYSLTVAAMAFALGRAPEFSAPRSRWALSTVMALALCGSVLSMTRTVWAAAAVLFVSLLLVSLKIGLLTPRRLVPALLLPTALGVLVGMVIGHAMPSFSIRTDTPWEYSYQQLEMLSRDVVTTEGQVVTVQATPDAAPQAGAAQPPANPQVSARKESAFLDRLLELLALDNVPTFVTRQKVMVKAVDGWLERPWLGWGLGTYRYVYPPPPGEGFWIPNMELHLLFDTGIAGLLLFGAAVVMAAGNGLRALRVPVSNWNTTQFTLFGLVAGGGVLLFAYQLTEATWLGFTWVFFAMLVAAGRYARVNEPDPSISASGDNAGP